MFNFRDRRRNRALLDAAREGEVEKVAKLLRKGADINAGDVNGSTPLHEASWRGHVNVAELLVSKGADVNAKTKDGSTPLDCAYNSAMTKLLQNAIEKQRASEMDYVGHLGREDSEIDSSITASSIEASSHIKNVSELLLTAASEGDLKKASKLLRDGADVNTKDADRTTPLHKACEYGHVSVAKLLISKGADVNAVDADGWTSLHYASSNDHVNIAELLISNRANVNAKDKDGDTPLHKAIEYGHVSTAELLISNGSDVSAKNEDGSTPLHEASMFNRVNVAKLLISKGANINAKDKDGVTPIDLATSSDDMSKLLQVAAKNQRDPNATKPSTVNQLPASGIDPVGHLVRKDSEIDSIAASSIDHDDATNKNASNHKTSLASASELTNLVLKLTDDDVRFLKTLGQSMGNNESDINIPLITEKERSALQALTSNLIDFERSLESVRELPPSLIDKDPQVSKYFFFFTSAFERTFVAARAVSSGCVEVQLDMVSSMMETLLCGAGLVADKSNLPFAGCISIFSTIIMHQRKTKRTNLFMAFEDFFRGNSRDQYLLTYRKLAETFCLRLDLSLLDKDNSSGTMSKLKDQVSNKIISPIRNHLRKVHLDVIQELSPVEEKAMSDLAMITKEVLRLYRKDQDTYIKLQKSNENEIVPHFVACVFGKELVTASPSKRESRNDSLKVDDSSKTDDSSKADGLLKAKGSSETNIECEPGANKCAGRTESSNEQRMAEKDQSLEQQMMEKIQSLEQNKEQLNQRVRKLEAEIKSEKDVNTTVSNGRQDLALINPNKSKAEIQRLEGLIQEVQNLRQEIQELRIEQEKQSRDMEKIKFENFVNNRVLSYHETLEFIQKVVLEARDENGDPIRVSDEGVFWINGKKRCIGKVAGHSGHKTLWKGKVGIKLEDDHQSIKSVLYWFDEIELRPLYERNKKKVIHELFCGELDESYLPDMAQPYKGRDTQGDCDLLFDNSPDLR